MSARKLKAVNKLANKTVKRNTKSLAKRGALGLAGVALAGGKKKSPEKVLARRKNRHAKAVKSGNAARIAKSERKNKRTATRQGKRIQKREAKNPGKTARIAAKRTRKGKTTSGALKFVPKAAAKKVAAKRAPVARKTPARTAKSFAGAAKRAVGRAPRGKVKGRG